ncbi:hypothetical protein K8I61_07435 [bacterium]|nr:hypothetical protein [bacterium]
MLTSRRALFLFTAICLIAAPALAEDANVAGEYKGTVSMNVKIPMMEQDVTKNGTATVKVTPVEGNRYKVEIVTELSDLPGTNETSEYLLEGSTLKMNATSEMGGMKMVSNGRFTVSGSSMSGEVSTVGSDEDSGEMQTSSKATFQLGKT